MKNEKKIKLNPKIAVFHSCMDNIGGAEILSLTLAQKIGADFYSTNIDKEKIKKMGFNNINIKSIGKVPTNPPFRQQKILSRFRKLNLKNKYDLYIISGDWAISAAINNKPCIWYVHSPIREIWDLYEYTRNNTVPLIGRPIFDLWVKYNRYLNKKYSKTANTVVCNSFNTQKRIKQYLNIDANIINPPIKTSDYFFKQNGNFWLSVNRLITHKRIEMQLEAFSKMPKENLIIVGSYEKSIHFKKYADKIKKIKYKNIKILSWIDYQELINLYANCKGFITTAKDEDFGMSAVEATAAGKPVIAPDEGGYKETVINGTNGILINNINEYKIRQAVKKINKDPSVYKKQCLIQAQKFDTKIFIEKINQAIKKTIIEK
jgi:glycosyltransferase involved in cell wall biosynthesis